MIRRIELLVHAGAPSSRKDDDRYRAQAETYLTLRGSNVDITRTNIYSHGSEKHRPLHSNGPANLVDKSMAAEPQLDATTFVEDTQLAYTALDSQILTSSLVIPPADSNVNSGCSANESYKAELFRRLDPESQSLGVIDSASNREPSVGSRPGKKRPRYGVMEVGETDKAAEERPRELPNRSSTEEHSEHSRSSYLKSPILHRSAKKVKIDQDQEPVGVVSHGRLHGYLQLPENGTVGLAYVGYRPSESRSAPATPGITRSETSGDANQSTSELPTTYSLSEVTSGSSKARLGISQRSASDPGPNISSTSPGVIRKTPPSRKFDKTGHRPASERLIDTQRTAPTNIEAAHRDATDRRARPNSDIHDEPRPGISEAQQNELVAPRSSAQILLDALSTSIQPPTPPVSLGRYTTHITSALRYIAELPDLAECFKPVSTSRELRLLERGYWLIECSTDSPKFSLDKQIAFWHWLEKYIGNGSAGWGVWCTRDVKLGPTGTPTASIGTVKAYCWGEVVKHVYHLLYVASNAQVRKMGLQWVDGGGEVVVQMRNG